MAFPNLSLLTPKLLVDKRKPGTSAYPRLAENGLMFEPFKNDTIFNSNETHRVAAAIALYSWRYDKLFNEMMTNHLNGYDAKRSVVDRDDWDGLVFGAALLINIEAFVQTVVMPKNVYLYNNEARGLNIGTFVQDMGVVAMHDEENEDGSTRCTSWEVIVSTNLHLDEENHARLLSAVLESLNDVCTDPEGEFADLFDDFCESGINYLLEAFSPFSAVRDVGNCDEETLYDEGYVFKGSTSLIRPEYETKGFISSSKDFDVALAYAKQEDRPIRTDAFILDNRVPIIDVRHILSKNPKFICWNQECEVLIHPRCIYIFDDRPSRSHFDRTETDGDDALYINEIILAQQRGMLMDVYNVFPPAVNVTAEMMMYDE